MARYWACRCTATGRPNGSEEEKTEVNPLLTIHRAKIAQLRSRVVVSRVKRGSPPWTPVRSLTFGTVALRPPGRRSAAVTGIRERKWVPWLISRRGREGAPPRPTYRAPVKLGGSLI